METGRLLTVSQVAELTGWRESTVRAHILHRRIAYFKLGRSVRIAERDVERLLAKSRIPADAEVLSSRAREKVLMPAGA